MTEDAPKPIEDLVIRYDEVLTPRTAWSVFRHWRRAPPWMQSKAVNYAVPRLAVVFSLIVLSAHAFWAVHSQCGTNFARGGGVIALIVTGLFAVVEWHKDRRNLLSGGTIEKFDPWHPQVVLPVLAGIGTLIWAFGDFLPWFGLCVVNRA